RRSTRERRQLGEQAGAVGGRLGEGLRVRAEVLTARSHVQDGVGDGGGGGTALGQQPGELLGGQPLGRALARRRRGRLGRGRATGCARIAGRRARVAAQGKADRDHDDAHRGGGRDSRNQRAARQGDPAEGQRGLLAVLR